MMMKTYLVGGCVRDKIMGLQPNDIDYVITGATEHDVESMISMGYTRVGNDFPVFLHPDTGDEYALARKERKVSAGYNGFEMYTSPDLTIEDDLIRRDLTINAIAIDIETGELIDPYDGRSDINDKILRHVSDAFAEDPLRVLRVARFAARFTMFRVANETMNLLKRIVNAGEMQHLTKERVWAEFEKILGAKDPLKGLTVLADCGALQILFPEVFVNMATMKLFRRLSKMANSTIVDDRFYFNEKTSPEVMFAFLAKGMSVNKMQEAKMPSTFIKLIDNFTQNFNSLVLYQSLDAESQLELLIKTGCIKDTLTAKSIIELMAYSLGATFSDRLDAWMTRTIEAIMTIKSDALITPGMVGAQIGEAIKQERIKKIKQIKERSYDHR